MIEYVPKSLKYTDLFLNQYGIEQCGSLHAYGPAVRDHYLIHYILGGKGIFEVGEHTYHLGRGDVFLICPDEVTYYQADEQEPWHYCWVGFHGVQAESILKQAGLTPTTPILHYEGEQLSTHFHQLISVKASSPSEEIRLIGLLYTLLSAMVEGSSVDLKDTLVNKQEIYVKKVIDFVERNYSSKFTISQIADFVGLDRSYLCSLFKKMINSSIQEYVIHYRMNKAAELMINQNLNIGDVSRSVGYDDPLLFSKTFKKVMGTSPKQYRQEQNAQKG